jgi:protein PhnA
MNEENEKVVDAFGNELQSGDSVQLTKELKVKGTKVVLKKGTVVKNIRLTDDPDEIDCSAPGVKKLVLRTEFVKKK